MERIEDMRLRMDDGTGESDGEFQIMSRRNRMDDKAIVEWAACKLEGSDGCIALIGCSFPAGLALATAADIGKNTAPKTLQETSVEEGTCRMA